MWRASSSGAGAGYWNRPVRYKCRIIAVGATLAADVSGFVDGWRSGGVSERN